MKMAITSVHHIYSQLCDCVRHDHVTFIVPRNEIITTFGDFEPIFKHTAPKSITLLGKDKPVSVINAPFLIKTMRKIIGGKISIGGHLSSKEDSGEILVDIQSIYNQQLALEQIDKVYDLLIHYEKNKIPGKEKDIQPAIDDMRANIHHQLRELSETDSGLVIAKTWYKKRADQFPPDESFHKESLIRHSQRNMTFKKGNIINHKLRN